MALRLFVALPLGYALSAVGGICAAFWLPLSKADAAMAGILLGLILWPVIFMASFAFMNTRRLAGVTIALVFCLTALAVAKGWRP